MKKWEHLKISVGVPINEQSGFCVCVAARAELKKSGTEYYISFLQLALFVWPCTSIVERMLDASYVVGIAQRFFSALN